MKRSYLILFSAFILFMATFASLASVDDDLPSQTFPTATPVQAILFTPTSLPTQDALPTTTPTVTPTTPPPVVAEVAENIDGAVNVRSLPDPEAELVGSMEVGQSYAVLASYFSWYQIQFDSTPSGVGWVFNQLVNIVGDSFSIVEVDPFAAPTVDPNLPSDVQAGADPNLAQASDSADPAVQDRIIVAPTRVSDSTRLQLGSDELVTFTPPPDFDIDQVRDSVIIQQAAANAEELTAIESIVGTSLPPVAPIIVIGGVGVLFLLIGLLRR